MLDFFVSFKIICFFLIVFIVIIWEDAEFRIFTLQMDQFQNMFLFFSSNCCLNRDNPYLFL